MTDFFKTFDAQDRKLIIRLSIFLVAWINQILSFFGKSPFKISDAEINFIITNVLTLFSSIYMLWKNNNFTKNARGKQNDFKIKQKRR